jgi:DNA-binding GntR family transcriptional regulator
LSADEILELFEMRAALEENAAFVATSVRKSQDIEIVRNLLEGMQTLSEIVH